MVRNTITITQKPTCDLHIILQIYCHGIEMTEIVERKSFKNVYYTSLLLN